MGMSVSVSTAIIFIAAIISAGSIISTLDEVQASMMDAQTASSERELMASQTDIAIRSVDRDNATIEILNQGRTTLHLASLDVLLDGQWSNDRIASMGIVGHPDSQLWLPGDVLKIQFADELTDKSIKIVTGNGIPVYG